MLIYNPIIVQQYNQERSQMKVSTSHSSLFSKTLPTFGTRKRVASLKNRNRKQTENAESNQDQAMRLKLQQSLENDMKRFSQLITEPESNIPGYDSQQPELKLWRYFLSRIELVQEKVEKEQINACERQFQQIGKLINKKKEVHLTHIDSFKRLVKQKQNQIHQLFEELKRDRMNKLLQTMNTRKNKKWALIDNTEQIDSLKDSIRVIREQVVKIEALCTNEMQEEDRLIIEWKAFLVNLLRGGYYMSNGVKGIFKEMIKHEYVPCSKDFPEFMDSTTISCLMKQYQSIRSTEQQKKTTMDVFKQRSFTDSRKVSPSIKSIREIAKQPKLSQIYKGTKDYIASWVKNGSWKEENFFPKLKERRQEQGNNWQTQEKRRMAIVYPQKQLHKKIKNLLFGPKVELLP